MDQHSAGREKTGLWQPGRLVKGLTDAGVSKTNLAL